MSVSAAASLRAKEAWRTRRNKQGFYKRKPSKPKAIVDTEEEVYQKARVQTEKALASGTSKKEIERQLDGTLLQLQSASLFSTKGGFGGAPDYDKVMSAIRALERVKTDLRKGKIG